MRLSLSPKGRDWAMLAANNISIEDLLESSGLGADSRWFDARTELSLVLAFCAVLLLGLAGNAMVAFFLCRDGNIRSPRHWYLLNLVVADLLTCVLCVPFTLLRLIWKDWRLGQLLCRLAPFLQLTYVFVSIFTIQAIAVERYRAIVSTTRLQPERRRAARLVIPAIWLLALGLATPIAFSHQLEYVYNVTGERVLLTLCVEHWDNDALLWAYTTVILLFQYAFPAAIIMALHLLICCFLRKRVHLRKDNQQNCPKMARHRKNLLLLTAISIAFDVEWLPITVVNMLADFDPSVFASASQFCLIYALCLLFALSSVFLNPVMYGWFNSNFRRDLCASRNRRASSDRSGSNLRRFSSQVTSRFTCTVPGSSTFSGHRGSADTASVSALDKQAKMVSRRRRSMDEATRTVLQTRNQAGRKGHRMSLQF